MNISNKTIKFSFALAVLVMSSFYIYQSFADAFKVNKSAVNNLTNGLVGYWTFDGADMTATQALDMSTNDNAGTLTGTARIIGKIGQGLNFNGTSDFVSLADSPVFDPGGAFSACGWFYVTQNTSNKAIISHTDSASQATYKWIVGYLSASSAEIKSYVRIGGTAYSATSATQTAGYYNNAWHHICSTFDKTLPSSRLKVFIDGVSNGSGNAANGDIDAGDMPTIGRWGGGIYFPGSIDEVRVYNRALSQSEITELYQQGQAKINASQVGKLTNGLTGYWTFDGADMTATTALDMSTNNNVGTLTGTTRTIGKIGQGLSFNGTSDKIFVAEPVNNVLDGMSALSVEAWVYNAGQSGYGRIVQKGNYAAAFGGYELYGAVSNGLTFRVTNSSDASAAATIALPLNEWAHVVGIYDGANVQVYVNGAAGTPASLTGNIKDTSNGLYIGDWGNGTRVFNGKIDEVRIYNRALSQSEITELYQQGQTKINASQAGKLTNGLVVHQTFDGDKMDWSQASAEARDVSGNNNHGDVTNMTNAKAAIGKSGQALSFDGAGDYVNMGDINALDGQSYLTLSAWVKLNATGAYDQVIGKILDTNNRFQMSIDDDTYTRAVSVGVANGTYPYVVTPYLNLTSSIGSWHLWTMVFDGTQTGNANRLKFYYDGAQQTLEFVVGYDDIPATTPSVSSNLHIGRDTGQAPNAVIDEVRIYNRALSQSEVTELYNLGR